MIPPASTAHCEDPVMRRALPLLLAAAVLAGCGGDDESAAPCELLDLATAQALVGDGIERILVADVLPEQAEDDERACIYAPPGTEVGDQPDTAAALQLDRERFASKGQLLASSQVGGILPGFEHGAIIEEEDGGYTVVVRVDDELSFALVARSPDIERDAVIDLAKEIESQLD
jgi:hypothetical protein